MKGHRLHNSTAADGEKRLKWQEMSYYHSSHIHKMAEVYETIG